MSLAKAPDILRSIIANKQQEISAAKTNIPLTEIKAMATSQAKSRGFVLAIKQKLSANKPAIIAEIKQASPSKGVIRTNFNASDCAIQYQNAGATCLSVLTDEKFFQGSNEHLIAAHKACSIPILRKDFILEPYQIYQAKVIGADCILLIVAVLSLSTMQDLVMVAQSLDLDVLVEVHNLGELETSLQLDLPMIGINNRNLHDFTTDLQTTIKLLPTIPSDKIVVTESGILHHTDVQLMSQNGVNTFLVGEALMQAKDVGLELKQLLR